MSDPAPASPDPAQVDPEALQKRAEAAELRVKELEKEVKPLREFHSTSIANQREATFTELAMSDAQKALFLKTFEGDTFDASTVKAWADEHGVNLGGQPSPAPASTPAAPPPYSPTQVAGAAAPNVTGMVTREEMEAIARKDPAEAARLFQEGKVKWANS